MSSTSAKLGLPFISQQQATPEITHNEAILMMSAFQVGVESMDLDTPPASPNEGDCYIIGSTPTDEWAGRPRSIAIYFGNGWRFVPDRDSNGTIITMGADQAGMRTFVKPENGEFFWSGSEWIGVNSIPAEPMRFGQRSFSDNSTVIAVTAAVDQTLGTNSDYVQVAGIYNPVPDGSYYGVTQQTNSMVIQRSGYYRPEFWANAKSSINNTQCAFKFAVNGVISLERRPAIYMRNTGEIHGSGAFGYTYFNAGDVITLWIASDKTANITLIDGVFGIQSLTNGPTDVGQLPEYLNDFIDVEIDSSLADGQVLKYNELTQKWVNSNPPLSLIENLSSSDSGTASTSAYATKGNIILASVDFSLNGIMQDIGTAGDYKFVIAKTNSSYVITELLHEIPSATYAVGTHRLSIAGGVPVSAGDYIAILIVRTDGTDITPAGVPFPATVGKQSWFYDWVQAARIDSSNPAVSDDITYNDTSSVITRIAVSG